MMSAAILGVGFTASYLNIHDSDGDGLKVQDTVSAGTRVTIEITPDDGDVFYAWSGDPSGNESPLVVTLDGIITVGAACTSAIYQNYCTKVGT